MREILFRGKNLLGKWIEGDLLQYLGCEKKHIVRHSTGAGGQEVIPSTIGEYTGLKDKNDKMIFEGDIVKNEWCFIKGNSIVRFGEYKSLDSSNDYQCGHLGFYLEHISDFNKRTVRKDIMYFANKCEIIGNAFDNPEMLKEG